MAKRKSKTVPALPAPEPLPTNNPWKLNLFVYLIQVLFWFDIGICLRPIQWLLMVVVRGFILWKFCHHDNAFFEYITPPKEENFVGLLYGLFIFFPIMMFVLWYYLTTILLFLTALYGRFGYTESTDEAPVQLDYEPIQKFLEWRNNKMKFTDYESAAQLLRDTAILNNLETTQNDPEARKTLNYISNKMRFMSHPAALEFLRGKKSN